jgi:tetratricopeptide (TPR) repeat protein
MLEKIERIKTWQASLILTVIGLGVYSSGLTNPFQGDDYPQIVNNIPVHSITNIRLFFEGGTIYTGQGSHLLTGVYFRPLMTTVFSLIYTVFGPHPIYFHLFQLLICIGSSILFYLFLRYSFTPLLSLFLALVLLVHPIDSEMIFSIPVTQDALYFFLGMLGLYSLLKLRSNRSLILTVFCLLLSLFAKETAIVFLIMSCIYLFWWDRKRLLPFIGMLSIPLVIYVVLRVHAIGLLGANPHVAPIDQLSLSGRLMTAPAIILFYLVKFIFPWKLAFAYYWIYSTFSLRHTLLPLLIEAIFAGILVYEAIRLRSHASRATYYTYLFFVVWLVISYVILIQIFPLDETASESWFYASMVGILGILGVFLKTWHLRFDRRSMFLLSVLVVTMFSVQTCLRGLNYKNQTTLAYHDIKVSKEDYVADTIIATDLYDKQNYTLAKIYAEHSLAVFPYEPAYDSLGTIDFSLGEYAQAQLAYTDAVQYGPSVQLYDNVANLFLYYQKPDYGIGFISQALHTYPRDNMLWLDLAILEYKTGNSAHARQAISQAYSLGQNTEIISAYLAIMHNEPLVLNAKTSGS